MTIAITSSGISLDGPLVAGEKVAVTVSGLALEAEDKPTLALLARFPDALLASVELAESETAGTWTGELDTATKQTALFFATARADERRDAALELVAGRVSLARLTVPMANSALCPKPDGSPFASPVYVPVPGPPGKGGDPYDQAPQMDGEASAGSAEEYARGDHRHPTDETRQAVIGDLAAIRSGAAAGATAVQPAALSAYRTAAAQDAIDAGKLNATGLTNNNGQLGALDFVTRYSFGFEGGKFITAPENSGAALTDNDIADSSSALGGALAAKANSSALAAVATTGDYADLNNKPTIPSAYGPFTAREEAVASQTREQTSYGKGGAATSDGNGNTWSSAFPKNTGTLALQEGIAPAFSTSSTYAVGDYCTHEGLLYKCTTAVTTAGAWNAANWTAETIIKNLPYDAELEYIVLGDNAYIDTGISGTNTALNFSATFKPENALPSSGRKNLAGIVGGSDFGIFKYNGKTEVAVCLFKASATNQSSLNQWSDGQFHTLSVSGTSVFVDGVQIVTEPRGSTGLSSNFYFGKANNSTSVSTFYSAASLSIGDTVLRDYIPVRKGTVGYFYDRVSNTLFGSAGTGTIGLGPDKAATLPLMDGTAAHGSSEEMAPIDHVHPTDTSRAPLASPAFTGAPTAPTAAAGTNTTQIATTAFVQGAIRYSFASPTPSVSGTSATVACGDRAINDFTVATGITSLTITPPAAVTGRARDFFCRVTLTDSSLPTVTLSGATIDIGASEVAGMTQGVNLLMFTEIASGHWLASRRSAS